MALIKKLLKDLWNEFEYTTAIEVGYVLSKDKMQEPFGKMQPPVIDGKILDLDHYGFSKLFQSTAIRKIIKEKNNRYPKY